MSMSERVKGVSQRFLTGNPFPVCFATHAKKHSYGIRGRILSRHGAWQPAGGSISHDDDRRFFLKTLSDTCERTGWHVHAWVLMNNHHHLMIQTPEANLVEGMKRLQNTHTRRLNTKHRVLGRVFGDRTNPCWWMGAVELETLPGSDPRKLAIAWQLSTQTSARQGWIAGPLLMKSAANVSRQLRRLRGGAHSPQYQKAIEKL